MLCRPQRPKSSLMPPLSEFDDASAAHGLTTPGCDCYTLIACHRGMASERRRPVPDGPPDHSFGAM